jgi:arginine utilization protein RocB
VILKERFMDTLIQLVSSGGISGTKDENSSTEKIYELLNQIQYFKQNPKNLKVIPLEDDPLGRGFISALVEATDKTKDTIIITGHLDVVGIDNFVNLKSIAFNVKEITNKIRELSIDNECLNDLNTGEWLFGRGVADMKYGIALCIEILRWFCAKNIIPGNILFLAVPGEESNSEGMLAAVPYLEKMQSKGYNFKACFNTECTVPRWNLDYTKRIYTGTIGKVMPLFFSKGKESHVCNSLDSFNPNLVIAEITRIIENNPDFCSEYKGEFNPPPSCLKQTDLKELYNVQTPLYATGYYNLLTLKLDGESLLKKLRQVALTAFNNVQNRLNEHSKKFSDLTGKNQGFNDYKPIVITFKEIWEFVINKDNTFETYIDKKIKEWQNNNFDNQTISIKILKELSDRYGDNNPLIIVGFAPPFYPSRVLEGTSNDKIKLINIIDNTLEFAKESMGQIIEKCYFYDAICDLSYTGIDEQSNMSNIYENMPGLKKNYLFPFKALAKLDIPGVVFGGLGKDFHKNTERLYVPYSLEVVPKMYQYIIENIFT